MSYWYECWEEVAITAIYSNWRRVVSWSNIRLKSRYFGRGRIILRFFSVYEVSVSLDLGSFSQKRY